MQNTYNVSSPQTLSPQPPAYQPTKTTSPHIQSSPDSNPFNYQQTSANYSNPHSPHPQYHQPSLIYQQTHSPTISGPQSPSSFQAGSPSTTSPTPYFRSVKAPQIKHVPNQPQPYQSQQQQTQQYHYEQKYHTEQYIQQGSDKPIIQSKTEYEHEEYSTQSQPQLQQTHVDNPLINPAQKQTQRPEPQRQHSYQPQYYQPPPLSPDPYESPYVTHSPAQGFRSGASTQVRIHVYANNFGVLHFHLFFFLCFSN